MEWPLTRGLHHHNLLRLLLLLASSCFIQMASGRIVCLCNTRECLDKGSESCYAKHFCFVEFERTGTDYKPQTRGCIDKPTPINCERFLPQPKGFLRTLCCDSNLCNSHKKMPKLPTRNRLPRPGEPCKNCKTASITPSPQAVDTYMDEKPGVWRAPMNPMHIAGPIAAACIVVSMIIFVIFLIKRKESQTSTDNLVYADYDPALLAALANAPDRDETVTPVLNPVLYNPFLKVNKSPV